LYRRFATGGRLARYKVPRSVVFAAELPKTGANKIDKKKLKEQHR
jgi:acyl-CoA synthetase (AMP-forming)/AMP-acid ligase II